MQSGIVNVLYFGNLSEIHKGYYQEMNLSSFVKVGQWGTCLCGDLRLPSKRLGNGVTVSLLASSRSWLHSYRLWTFPFGGRTLCAILI